MYFVFGGSSDDLLWLAVSAWQELQLLHPIEHWAILSRPIIGLLAKGFLISVARPGLYIGPDGTVLAVSTTNTICTPEELARSIGWDPATSSLSASGYLHAIGRVYGYQVLNGQLVELLSAWRLHNAPTSETLQAPCGCETCIAALRVAQRLLARRLNREITDGIDEKLVMALAFSIRTGLPGTSE